MVSKQFMVVVLVAIASLVSAVPFLPEIVEEVHGASTSASTSRIFEEQAKSPLRELAPKNNDPYRPSIPFRDPNIQESRGSKFTSAEERIKYGQSWGAGGKFVHWMWRHIFKPALYPLKKVWQFFSKPIITKPKVEPGEMSAAELKALLREFSMDDLKAIAAELEASKTNERKTFPVGKSPEESKSESKAEHSSEDAAAPLLGHGHPKASR